MGLGETSAVEPADEVNKEVGESISNRSLEMQGEDWLPGEMESRNLNWMVYAGMEEATWWHSWGYRQAGTLGVTALARVTRK